MKFRSKKLQSMVNEYARNILDRFPEEHEYLEEETFLMLGVLSDEWEEVLVKFQTATDYEKVMSHFVERYGERNSDYVIPHILSSAIDVAITGLLEKAKV